MSLSPAQKAMERSRILMVIFTPKFLVAYSNKLFIERPQKVTECHKTMNKPVVPVFWGVKQKQVVNHLATRYKVLDWIGAAVDATSQSGFNLPTDSRNDSEIMNMLLEKLDEYLFHDLPPHPVGLHRQVKDVLDLLKGETYSMIGIWGVAGIGKTTFARAIYDRIGGKFESKSFLANINYEWKKDNGLLHLRQQLISDVLETESDLIHDVKMVTSPMKEVLSNKSVLVVFDDLNQIDQLIALCSSSDMSFGKRSLVFVTSINKDLLLDLGF
ncbi:disease resistance protein Roq1-like [Prosopis cineraria]|uniref:disease resistance protein Roq1-like n=1 Tax=Prosopis cineraria TaxID=364024 RepID=UPI00240ECB7D|nr:disease resistance protein Roq1-like [Prosopis cineraria]